LRTKVKHKISKYFIIFQIGTEQQPSPRGRKNVPF
jgi:hypothetical protein